MATQEENLNGLRQWVRAVLADPAVLAVPGLARWMRATAREVERDIREDRVMICTQSVVNTMKRYRREAREGRLVRVSGKHGSASFEFYAPVYAEEQEESR